MPYKRKTRDEYNIEGNYGHGFERVHTEDTLKEARARLKEYREHEPGTSFRLKKKRVYIEQKEQS